ncbi:MAG: cytochrome ubiquinol oxidase subunit I [Sedimentisphaerales bacterium]|nr:cytochrome ubiquinol oxidase subunit I [Sedimentisphaerales bacterium]
MILAAATNPFIQSPGGAKFSIAFLGLFHTAVASLAIGFAFIVTVLQLLGYFRRDGRYDLLARRVQLWHVCIYNIGTINAIGLVFALSGLYPQFWSQIFTHFFWTLIAEELLFFMLATTLTLHYFFWDTMWGHKRLHIFMGALLTPMFFLQFFIINGMGSYMLTPAFSEGQVSLWSGTASILGWDKLAFYNPSFLMLTLHRTAANFAYGAFFVAAVCGIMLYRSQAGKKEDWSETGGRLAFSVGFMSFLTLPIIGFFYAWVLKYHGKEAYDNLMVGQGDVVAGGIDWWWTKQLIVAAMLGTGFAFARRSARTDREFSLPMVMVYTLAGVYFMFYLGMGMQMTWLFFWGSLGAAVLAGLWVTHLLDRYEGSGRAVFVLVGILSFLTVCLGGYVREAARPRFTNASGERVAGFNRLPQYADVYYGPERPGEVDIRMVLEKPAYMDELSPQRARVPDEGMTGADLVSARCISCHTLERIHVYKHSDWDRVVGRMRAYGTRLTEDEAQKIVDYLEGGQ